MDIFSWKIFKTDKSKDDKAAGSKHSRQSDFSDDVNPRQSSVIRDFNNDEVGKRLKQIWKQLPALRKDAETPNNLEQLSQYLLEIINLLQPQTAEAISSGSIPGHPDEFVLDLFRWLGTINLNARDQSLGRFDVLLLLLVNILASWDHNATVICSDRSFSDCINKLIRSCHSILDELCDCADIANFETSTSAVCGIVMLTAQLISRFLPQPAISKDTMPLFHDVSEFTLPPNPWSLADMVKIGCSWYPSKMNSFVYHSIGSNQSIRSVKLNIMIPMLWICKRLDEVLAVGISRRSELSQFNSVINDIVLTECEVLHTCVCLYFGDFEKTITSLLSVQTDLVRYFALSTVAKYCYDNKDEFDSRITSLISRRGVLLIDVIISTRDYILLQDIRSVAGISANELTVLIGFLIDFGSKNLFDSVPKQLNNQSIVEGDITVADILKNLCISCEYPQEFRLSRCSVDFWPWRGQKQSPEFGSYAEDVVVEDGEDVMQEMKIDEYMGKRYRMCCVKSVGFGSKSFSECVLGNARQAVLSCSGSFESTAHMVQSLLTSLLTVPSVTSALIESRFSYFLNCFELLKKRETQLLLPEVQLHTVSALQKILNHYPSETIIALRKIDINSLLLGPAFLGGGEVEINNIFNDSVFSEERVKKSSKITMKVWSAVTNKAEPRVWWKAICGFSWVSLKDIVLDLFCDIIHQSYSMNITDASNDIYALLSVMKRPVPPTASNLMVVYQTTRFLRHISHPEFKAIGRAEKRRLGRIYLMDIMTVIGMHLEIIGLAKQVTVTMGSISRQNMKMIWPARSSVVDFLLYISSVEFFSNLDWITLFLEKTKSAQLNDSVADIEAETANQTACRARLKTLESLLLDPRCRAASMRIISRLVSVYAVEMTMATESSSNPDQPNLKYYTFDVVGRIMSVVNFTVTQPTSVDSYNCALLCLRTLTWMLRAKKFLLLRQSIQYIFRNSDCMNSILQSMVGMLRPNEVKVAVRDSSERWLLGSIVKQGLALLTCIMASNESNKSHFAKLIHFNANPTSAIKDVQLNQVAQADTVDASPTTRKKKTSVISFEQFVMVLLDTEGSISLELVIVLFDMLLEVPCIRNRAMLSDPAILAQGLFLNDDDRPNIRNSGIIVLILSLLTACSLQIQRFILLTFSNLVNGRAALANLTICSQSKPNLLDLALDLFPIIPPANLHALVRLVQYLGRHSISVAQLKHIFRIMQGEAQACPVYNHRVLEALHGMISHDTAPFHTFVFEGNNSGLRLPPIVHWPAKSGFSFCVWFLVESPKGIGADKSEVDDYCDEEKPTAVLGYKPYLLSMRSGGNSASAPAGSGLEIGLKMTEHGTFRPFIEFFSSNSSCLIEADSCVRESEWNFLAVSIAGSNDWTDWARLRSTVGSYLIVGTSCKKISLSFPFSIQETIHAPLIGCSPASSYSKELNKSQTSFRGQMGAIYMFSEAITAAKLMGIQELGPAYQYNFEAFTAEYKDTYLPSKMATGASQLSSNSYALFDGSLTQSIMLAYNPAVWANDLVVDNTPSRNGIRWHIGSSAASSLELFVPVDDRGYYKMSAKAGKGTYHTKSQDIRMALDSLGGIKSIFPLFSQFDQVKTMINSNDLEDTGAKSISFWFFTLLSTLVQDAAVRKREVKSLSVLGYLMESVSPDNFTLDISKILRVIYENLSWNGPAQDLFLESILANFRLWKACKIGVQLDLYRWLLQMVNEQYSKVKDVLTPQKLIDALSLYFEYKTNSEEAIDNSATANISDDNIKASVSELREIRSVIVCMLHALMSKASTLVKEDVPLLIGYVCSSPSSLGQIEILQCLLLLLMNSSVNGKVLSGLGISSCLSSLAIRSKSRDSSVRMYALLVISKCFVICSNSLPQQSCVSHEAIQTADLGDQWMHQDDMNSSFVSEARSVSTIGAGSVSQASENANNSTKDSKDLKLTAFEDLGISPGTLVGFITSLQENLLACLKEHSSDPIIESQIICTVFQMTMFGVGSSYGEILSAINWLDKDEYSASILTKATESNIERVENEIECCFEVKDGVGNIRFQLTTDVSICIPMIFAPLMNFIRDETVSSELRMNVLVNMRACLSMSDNNCDTILHLPFWQKSVLDVYASENARFENLKIKIKLSEAANTPIDMTSARLITKASTSCDICLRILCELQVAAIRFGKPVGSIIIRRKHESIAPSDIMDTLRRISKGERSLGVLVLRETLSCLRIMGSLVRNLNVQDIGCILLVQTLAALKREQELFQKRETTSKDTVIEKLFHLNIWLVVSVVLDFMTVPLKRIVLSDDADILNAQSVSTEGISISTIAPKLRTRTSSSVNASASSPPTEKTKYVSPTWYISASSPEGIKLAADLVEEYALTMENVLLLMNAIFQLLSKFLTSGGVVQDRKFLLSVTPNIGIYTGSRLMTKIAESVDNVISVPRNPSDNKIIPKHIPASALSVLKKTPLMNATGGVSWIMIRVLGTVVSQKGFIGGTKDNWCIPPAEVINMLQLWLASCETNVIEYSAFEFLYALTRLVEALRDPNVVASHACVRASVELVVRLAVKHKNSIYEIIDNLQDHDVHLPVRSISSAPLASAGIVSRLISGYSTHSLLADDETSSISTRSLMFSDASSVIDASPAKLSRPSPANLVAAANDSTTAADCMKIFDAELPTTSTFDELVLRIFNVAIGANSGQDSNSTNYIRWELWDKICDQVCKQARSMQDGAIDNGMPQHLSEIFEEFESIHAEFSKLSFDWNVLNEQSFNRLLAQCQIHITERQKAEEQARRKISLRWSSIVSELANERGPWGYSTDRNDIFWMLDVRETSKRQRPRMKRNIYGSHHQVATRRRNGKKGAGNAEESSDSEAAPALNSESNVADIWKDLMKYKRTNAASAYEEERAENNNNNNVKIATENNSDDEDEDVTSIDSRTVSSWDSETTVLFSANVEVITIASNSTGGRSSGTLELTRNKITFTKSSNSDTEPLDLNKLEYSWVYQSIPTSTWQTADIHLMFQRMYLLQFTAVELMFTNRLGIFFNLFTESIAKRFYRCIQRIRPPFLQVLGHRNPEKAVRSALMTGGSSLVLTNAWVQRQISNFDYLMSLNTIAGRTFHDLGQYPIFPWVIADYTSSRLDLTRPETFRNFAYSVGAQTEQQRQMCIQRYRDALEMYESNPSMEFPPFHHGTHYSCMGFVFWYLVRMEPFTSLHVWLQDGKFDHPDRLFASIGDAWAGTTCNHNDVKELIPEFFYLPEFLENVNGLDLGSSQSGVKLGDVRLPPWANSSLDFVRINRDALESEYVSANLHRWIDLIFGYKQRPPMFKGHEDAVRDCNVFFHLTYADAVNLEDMKIKDHELYERTIRQIDNYGQTPSRLFDRPHPQRRPLNKVKVIWPIASVVLGVESVASKDDLPERPRRIMCFNEEKVTNFPILFICEIRHLKRLVVVDASRIIGFHQFVTRQPDVVPPYSFKADSTALKISLGQQSQDNWFGFSSKVQREYFVGVPFSSLGLNSAKRRLMFTAQTQGVSLIGKDENKASMLRREADRNRGKSAGSSGELDRYRGKSVSMSSETMAHSSSKSSRNRDESSRRHQQRQQSSSTRTLSSSPSSSSTMSTAAISAATAAALESQPTKSKKYKSDTAAMFDHLSPHLFGLVPETKLLISCGHWDNSFKVTQVDTGKPIQSVIAHSDVVTCLAIATDFNQHWLVTGSRDCTVMVWDIYPDRPQPISSNPLILCGHDDTITCVAVNAEMDVVVSGSDDGTITVYSLREGTYIRSIILENNLFDKLNSNPQQSQKLTLPSDLTTANENGFLSGVPMLSKVEVHMVCVSRESYIIIYASDSTRYLLFSYSINGRFVEKIELPERLTCMCLSEDSRVLLTGGERCLVVMRWVHNLQIAQDGPRAGQEAILDGKEGEQGPFGSPIRFLYLTNKERHLIVGLESGDIRILAQDSEYLRKRLVSNLEDIGLIASSGQTDY